MHESSAFVTLTYKPECVPPKGSLSNEHWREFTKGIGYRYFGCGEYGDRTERPHYHLCVFGISPVAAEALCARRWPYGFFHVGPEVSAQVASYVAAYTCKKMTRAENEKQIEFLAGRLPEFARMSRRPAIGTEGLAFIRRWLVTDAGQEWIRANRDVPREISLGGKRFPLGRTLVGKLREWLDVPTDDPLRREEREAKLRVLHLDPILSAERRRLALGRYDTLKARVRRDSVH